MQRLYPQGTILKYLLENASPENVRQAVKIGTIRCLLFIYRQSIAVQFPLYANNRRHLILEGIDDLKPYTKDLIEYRRIDKRLFVLKSNLTKVAKFLPNYCDLVSEYNSLVLQNNELVKSETVFLKMWKKEQKKKGKNISIVCRK